MGDLLNLVKYFYYEAAKNKIIASLVYQNLYSN